MLIDKKRNIVNKRVPKLGDFWSWNSKNDYENKLFTHQKQMGKNSRPCHLFFIQCQLLMSQAKENGYYAYLINVSVMCYLIT